MGHALGIDFGTSNSTVAVPTADGARLIAVEGDHTTIPSAVFFNFETQGRDYGRTAITAYVDDHDGRFMKGLKSILGSDLMARHTHIRGRKITYSEIIAGFVGALKAQAETDTGTPARAVVAGRPVRFVDNDDTADAKAETTLGDIYRAAGFETVTFQYEPIAAALDYERQVAGEECVLIADLGGGTCDFSVVRVSRQRSALPDRTADILATSGVHIGGTDLDRLISVDRVMPLLGLGSQLRRDFAAGTLTIPRHIYLSLATWQHIHRLYDRKTLAEVHDYKRLSEAPQLIDRLERVLEDRLGHRLILAIERAKIALTDAPAAHIDLSDIGPELAADLTRQALDALIDASVQKIAGALAQCIADAGLVADDIDAIFFTGGTAAIPAVRRTLRAKVPRAKVVDGDRFGSVGGGLALEAGRRFGIGAAV